MPLLSSQKFWLKDAAAGATANGSLQDAGSNPAEAATTTKWTTILDSGQLPSSARQDYGATVAVPANVTGQPNGTPDTTGDSWVTESAITRNWVAGTWEGSIVIEHESGAIPTADGNVAIRLWKSSSQSGASATELTSGVVSSTTYTNIAGRVVLTWSVSLGAVSLASEYLLLQVALVQTGVGASTIRIKVGPDSWILPPDEAMEVQATAAFTQSADTTVATVTVEIQATATPQATSDTTAATATVEVQAAAAPQTDDSVAAAATVEVQASAAPATSDTVAATAAIEVQASAAPLPADDTISSAATVEVQAAAAPQATDDTTVATATVEVQGTSAPTVTDAVAAAATVEVQAFASPAVDDTIAATSTVEVQAIALPSTEDTVQANGTVEVQAIAAFTAVGDTVQADAVVEAQAAIAFTHVADVVGAAATVEVAGATALPVDFGVTAAATGDSGVTAVVSASTDLSVLVEATVADGVGVPAAPAEGVSSHRRRRARYVRLRGASRASLVLRAESQPAVELEAEHVAGQLRLTLFIEGAAESYATRAVAVLRTKCVDAGEVVLEASATRGVLRAVSAVVYEVEVEATVPHEPLAWHSHVRGDVRAGRAATAERLRQSVLRARPTVEAARAVVEHLVKEVAEAVRDQDNQRTATAVVLLEQAERALRGSVAPWRRNSSTAPTESWQSDRRSPPATPAHGRPKT